MRHGGHYIPESRGGSRGRLDGAHHADTPIADRFRSGGSPAVLHRARRTFPFIERIYADGRYSGTKMAATIPTTGTWKLEIVKRSDLHRFVVLLKRWIIERTFTWISNCCHLDQQLLSSGQGLLTTRQKNRCLRLSCAPRSQQHQTEPGRDGDSFGAAPSSELFEDPGDVKLRRVNRDGESPRDELVRCASGD